MQTTKIINLCNEMEDESRKDIDPVMKYKA